MAQKINLRESEYQAIVSELEQMHANILGSIATAMMEMRIMLTDGEIFSAELTSPQMADMLDTLSNDIVSLLRQAFTDSEAGVAKMIESVMTTDSIRG